MSLSVYDVFVTVVCLDQILILHSCSADTEALKAGQRRVLKTPASAATSKKASIAEAAAAAAAVKAKQRAEAAATAVAPSRGSRHAATKAPTQPGERASSTHGGSSFAATPAAVPAAATPASVSRADAALVSQTGKLAHKGWMAAKAARQAAQAAAPAAAPGTRPESSAALAVDDAEEAGSAAGAATAGRGGPPALLAEETAADAAAPPAAAATIACARQTRERGRPSARQGNKPLVKASRRVVVIEPDEDLFAPRPDPGQGPGFALRRQQKRTAPPPLGHDGSGSSDPAHPPPLKRGRSDQTT